MSDTRILANTENVSLSSEGLWTAQRGTKDGSSFTADFKLGAVMAGQGFHMTVGALSAPIVGGGAGTIVLLAQPEAIISVPLGTSMMPLRIHVQCETPLIAVDDNESEIIIGVDGGKAYDGTGTKVTEVAFNMLTNKADDGAACSVFSAVTANMTAAVLDMELARAQIVADVQGAVANALWGKLDLLYEPKTPPIIVGPAALYVLWGGTVATSGFAQLQFIEFDSAAF